MVFSDYILLTFLSDRLGPYNYDIQIKVNNDKVINTRLVYYKPDDSITPIHVAQIQYTTAQNIGVIRYRIRGSRAHQIYVRISTLINKRTSFDTKKILASEGIINLSEYYGNSGYNGNPYNNYGQYNRQSNGYGGNQMLRYGGRRF